MFVAGADSIAGGPPSGIPIQIAEGINKAQLLALQKLGFPGYKIAPDGSLVLTASARNASQISDGIIPGNEEKDLTSKSPEEKERRELIARLQLLLMEDTNPHHKKTDWKIAEDMRDGANLFRLREDYTKMLDIEGRGVTGRVDDTALDNDDDDDTPDAQAEQKSGSESISEPAENVTIEPVAGDGMFGGIPGSFVRFVLAGRANKEAGAGLRRPSRSPSYRSRSAPSKQR